MFDLHAHILPAVDDGARSLEESFAMAETAARDGIQVMAATLHGVERGPGFDRSQVAERISWLQSELDGRGIPLKIALGVETYLSPELPAQIQAGQAFGLGGEKYLLIELPVHQYPLYTEEIFFQVQVAGFTPIVAHPERNSSMQNDISLLSRLVERGAIGQVTAASLVGSFGPRAKAAGEKMLRRNLVHLIATDTHRAEGNRAPVLSSGRDAAARLIGEERARQMVDEIPRAILAGEPLRLEPPIAGGSARRPGWMFWR